MHGTVLAVHFATYHIMILVYFTVGSTSSGSAFVIAPNLGAKTTFKSISLWRWLLPLYFLIWFTHLDPLFWSFMCLSLRQIISWHFMNLCLYPFTSTSVQTSQSYRRLDGLTSLPGDTNSFQTLSSSDLANCKRLGVTFFCEGCTVLKTSIVHNCMGSLFLASATLIRANCKFRISETREKVFSLGNNTWLVYSVGTIAPTRYVPRLRSLLP